MIALALDLGSTRVKVAALAEDGRLAEIRAADAPPPHGEGAVRELDPLRLRATVDELLRAALRDAPRDIPLGIASQRSSFLLWSKDDGAPATPVISWQDRRAADWCARHRDVEGRVRELTGLPLSPHYAGPKLAAVRERDPTLGRRLDRGELLFGTLETWLLWEWSARVVHHTDASMAARTLFADVRRGEWSDELLDLFGAPRAAMPDLVATAGRRVALASGCALAASAADQSSSALAALGAAPGGALINFGTGTFVLAPCGERFEPRAGYLTTVLSQQRGTRPLLAREGTINAGGATLDRLARGPTLPEAVDALPDAFCLPDESGVGAPYWRPERTTSFSPAAASLSSAQRRRIALEGLVFRAAELVEAFEQEQTIARVVVAGGLSAEPALAPYLAGRLARAVEVLGEAETTLLGAGLLAADRPLPAALPSRRVEPEHAHAWLAAKGDRWRAWVAAELAPT